MSDYVPKRFHNITYNSGYKVIEAKQEGILSLRRQPLEVIVPANPLEMPRLFDQPFLLENIVFDLEEELNNKKDLNIGETDIELELKYINKYGYLEIGNLFSPNFPVLRQYIYERENYENFKQNAPVIEENTNDSEKNNSFVDWDEWLEIEKKAFFERNSDYNEWQGWNQLILLLGYLKRHRKRSSRAYLSDGLTKLEQDNEVSNQEYQDNLHLNITLNDKLKSINPYLGLNDQRHHFQSNCLLGNILIYYLAGGGYEKTLNCVVCDTTFTAKRSDAKFCVGGGRCSKIYQKAKKNGALDSEGKVRLDDNNQPIYDPI